MTLENNVSILDVIQNSNDNIKGWLPSDKVIDVSFPANGGEITAPVSGFFVCFIATSGSGYLAVDNTSCHELGNYCYSPNSATVGGYTLVNKGDNIWIRYSSLSKVWHCSFVCAQSCIDEYNEYIKTHS